MHVRGGMFNFAKGWCFELKIVFSVSGRFGSAGISIFLSKTNAGIVKLLVGQVGPVVAFPASTAAFKNPKPLTSFFRKRFILVVAETIDLRISRDQGAFKTGKRFGDIVQRDKLVGIFLANILFNRR